MAASLYIKQTWTDESTATPASAARMTTLETGITNAQYRPRGAIYATTIPATAHATTNELGTATGFTAMTFIEEYDSEGWHPGTSMNPGNVRIGVAGTYLITASIEWPSNATGNRMVACSSSGYSFAVSRKIAVVGDIVQQTAMGVALFPVGYRVGITISQSSGGSLTPTRARLTWTNLSY